MKLTSITGTKPILEATSEDEVFALVRPLRIYLNFEDAPQQAYLIDVGAVSNGRSGPSILNAIIPKYNAGNSITWQLALWYHDLVAYTAHLVPKEESDSVLSQANEITFGKPWKRTAIYKGLQWFGNGAWNEPLEGIYKVNAGKVHKLNKGVI
jgi:hypothetical protein